MKQKTPETTSESAVAGRIRWARYRAFVEVSANGLPRARVIVAFAVLVAVIGAILIALSINGTSSGEYYAAVNTGRDPSLLAGAPQRIRSDEWNVGVPWTISQVQQGLPATSRTFPGGADADLPFGLPDRQPATIMEPQNWGFLFLDVGRAYAWKWWVPALSLVVAAFALMVTLLPRRPLVAAALSVGFFFSPFFQWWFEPAAQWPVAWGAITITAIVWALRQTTLRSRLVWAVLVGYLTTVMAAGIYAPFIIPVVYVVLFFGIGEVIARKRDGTPWRSIGLRAIPIAVSGAVGVVAVLVWLRSKSAVVDRFLGTVYPGQRLTPTGTHDYIAFARTLGASFSESLQNAGGFLGINSSEASSFFLLGIFLVPAGVWVAVRRRRRGAGLPWTMVGLLAFLVLVLAFIFVPGWNVIAHLLYLDLTNGTRMRIGIGLASFALIGVVARDLDEEDSPAPRVLVWGSAGLFLAIQLALAVAIFHVQGSARLWGASPLWLVFALVSGAAIYLFAVRRPGLGAVAFLVVTVASCAAVNPIYVGVFDLRDTTVAKSIIQLDKSHPGEWVGVGGDLDNAILLESGVTGFNGTQGAPSRTMWKQVDPSDSYSNEWNRLGAVIWTPGTGDPVVSNPAEDVISVTFDACSTFAQSHVDYVLSSMPINSPCLTVRHTDTLASTTFTVYAVRSDR